MTTSRRASGSRHLKAIDLRHHPAGTGLDPRFRKGFIYSDAWTDDARLVVLNARDAAEHGATVLTRVRCEHAERRADHWQVRLAPAQGDGTSTLINARALVNAAGPGLRTSFIGTPR